VLVRDTQTDRQTHTQTNSAENKSPSGLQSGEQFFWSPGRCLERDLGPLTRKSEFFAWNGVFWWILSGIITRSALVSPTPISTRASTPYPPWFTPVGTSNRILDGVQNFRYPHVRGNFEGEKGLPVVKERLNRFRCNETAPVPLSAANSFEWVSC